LFEHFHLNTKKHLDYLVFQKAFYMFITRKTAGLNRQDLHRDIVQLKEVMNSKRVDFDFPGDHESLRRNKNYNYLVGLIEGDGSFYLNKTGMTARLSLVTIRQDKILLEKIREFLLSQLDEHSCMLGSSKLINIHDKRVGDNKPISILEIY
jgi:hypothetical protein